MPLPQSIEPGPQGRADPRRAHAPAADDGTAALGHGHLPDYTAGPPQPLNRLTSDGARRFAFLLVPGFTYIGFASAIEPLRMANMVAGRALFEAVTVSPDGEAVRASNGVLTQPDYALDNLPAMAVVFVCGPNPIVYPQERRLGKWLRALAGRKVALGGIDTGSYLLAVAGLLNGYHCTIHWQDMEHMLTHFPRIIVSNHLFEIDRDRFTCSGGTAPMDMMLQLIGREANGPEIAAAAADLLLHDRVRADRDRQRIPLRQRLGTSQPRLRETVMIMEANLEEPLGLPELAGHVGVSQRHLERLFREKLACTPTQYYMELRLNKARQRLLYTEESITEIAHSCGFLSLSHFTRRYTGLFGITPSGERRRKLRDDPALTT